MTTIFVIILILAVIGAISKSSTQKKQNQVNKKDDLSEAILASIYAKSQTVNTNKEQSKEIYTPEIKTQPVKQSYSYQDDSIIDVGNVAVTIDYAGGYNQDYWGLGTKYQKELGLLDEDVKILNALIDTNNKFNTIRHCAITIIKLFIESKRHLEKKFKENGASLEDEINRIGEIEMVKHYRFRKNSYNYNNQLSLFKTTVYQCIYKQCENYLREISFVGRKTELRWYIISNEAQTEYNLKISSVLEEFLNKQSIAEPDEKSENELNTYSKSRWKNKLESLRSLLNSENQLKYYESVMQLGIQNKHNPAIENIFFEASKAMTKYNKELSLKLYVYYIHYDLISDVFDNKQFTKTIQKSLFKTESELHDFERLMNEFITDRKLEKALSNVSNIFSPKRKKIQLDKDAIKQVKQQHSGTVELLNEYLKDETNNTDTPIPITLNEEIKLAIEYPNESGQNSKYLKEIKLNEIQINTLVLFSKSGFSLTNNELEEFAKLNNTFKNSLIDSINDACYEQLDDILIEEDSDCLIINENYYNKILAQ